MKKILYILTLCISVASCSFLNENPQSGLEEQDVIKDAKSLYTTTVAPLYGNIGSNQDGRGLQGTYRGLYDLQTFTTDEAIIPVRGGDWQDGGLWQSLFLHTWTADNEIIRNTWNYLYGEVVRCNKALTDIDKYAGLLTDSQLIRYQAEVRGLRALYYFYLIDLFGNVPIITDESASELINNQRSEVFAFIWQELQDIYPLLSSERSNCFGAEYGRFTQPVAAFVMMKLAINAEVFTDDDVTDAIRPDGKTIVLKCGGEKLNAWQAVEYYAQQIRAAGHQLDQSMSDCFATHNEQSQENIFTIPMDKSQYTNRFKNQFRSLHYRHGGALGYGGENGSSATLEAVSNFAYNTEDEDVRFRMTYFADTVRVNDGYVILSDGDTLIYYPLEICNDLTYSRYIATAGARMYKYDTDPTGIFDGTLRENDIVLFRYADVLLMEAEAKLRNGVDGSAELNQVRERSNMQKRECTVDNILVERMLELAWEGWRRQDMIRFGIYTNSYPLSHRPQVAGEHDGYGHTTVFPLPQSVIDMNASLKQNNGYD